MVYTLVVHLHAKPDQESITKLIEKLKEASQVYSKDKETLGWFVMQDHKDPQAFTIVERYENEKNLENPYWKTFDPYVVPLLDRPMDLRRLNELCDETSAEVKVEGDEGLWERVRRYQSEVGA
ncbi:hypothetical protein AC578_6315 [Pseudocercospora eumusae]|uniref:ABM domain-containing protein n=1 Tax=Pseudocercospora eumusae TaxID=321146 RepID=A0A139H1Z4_9PEZI|nr:hypothetical protein AC578_6315 [Pseudocercospora eumusae]